MTRDFSARDFVLGIATGGAIAVAFLSIGAFVLLRSSNKYNLEHWKLNIRTPFPSMWMNLGFWKTYDGKTIVHFNEATRALLERIVDAAGLLVRDDDPKTGPRGHENAWPVAVLDLGFGCGDQTIALAEMIQAQHRLRFKYVGLSLEASQVQTAQRALDRRLRVDGADAGASVSVSASTRLTPGWFKLFCANAAKPETWSGVIRASVDELADQSFSQQRWMLALDCLYHFSPSRKPAFRLAAGLLDANLMAFDLLLDDKASRWNTLLVRLIGLIMNCPLHTFMTEEQYREQLVECGYDGERIEMREISDHVFAGISGYLRQQDTALSQYDIGIGGFKLAGRLFEWFDRTRVVKAVIVVARTKASRARESPEVGGERDDLGNPCR
ncbi:hypothetical protein E4U21_006968 [Claviceps maximensis]|nr:hypothetical protein E4U21_006968 [Claviceps maximensis]